MRGFSYLQRFQKYYTNYFLLLVKSCKAFKLIHYHLKSLLIYSSHYILTISSAKFESRDTNLVSNVFSEETTFIFITMKHTTFNWKVLRNVL